MTWTVRYITDIQPDTPWVLRNGRKIVQAVIDNVDQEPQGLLADLVRLGGWGVWAVDRVQEMQERLEALELELEELNITRQELEDENSELRMQLSREDPEEKS